MKSYFLRTFFVLLTMWTIVRGGVYLLPGDPAEYLSHESILPITAEQIRTGLNLNQSLLERLFSFPHSHSLITREPISDLFIPAFQNTLILTLLTLFISVILTSFLLYRSFISARASELNQFLTTFFAAIPLFVFGPILILIFCVITPLFPITNSPWLPALCLSLYLSSFWYRTIDKKIVRFLPQSSVLGARARGTPEHILFLKNVLFPISGSIASYLGTQLGHLLSGSILVEVIFQWNGMGSLLLKAVHQRDYPIIEVTLLVTTFLTVSAQHLGYAFQKNWVPKDG